MRIVPSGSFSADCLKGLAVHTVFVFLGKRLQSSIPHHSILNLV